MRSTDSIMHDLQMVAAEIRSTQAESLYAAHLLMQQIEDREIEAIRLLQREYDEKLTKHRRRAERAETSVKASLLRSIDWLVEERDNPELRVASFIQLGSINDQHDESRTVPLIIPLMGHCNLCLDFTHVGENVDKDSYIRFIEGRALERTAPLQLEIISYDPLLRNTEAPFNATYDDGSITVRYIQSPRLLDSLIEELTEHVRRVINERLCEASTIIDYHEMLGTCVEPYFLVIMHDYPNSITPSQHESIMALARACCPTGISFVFELTKVTEELRGIDLAPIVDACECFVWETNRYLWKSHPEWSILISKATKDDARTIANDAVRRLSEFSPEPLKLDDLLPESYWQEQSTDGITFLLGMDGNNRVEVTLGSNVSQLHNVVITGAVGRGKSNLIKSIVYDLCARYSPDELELYLLDFKEGVTLYPMAPTKESPEFLPHARVIGLQADQDFGISVLEELLRISTYRSNIIKPFGDSILKYRSLNPEAVMPRILLVIDEFQLFLEGAQGQRATQLLVQVARTMRSYGIHILLASQSIGGITSLLSKAEQFFAQFPVRIGLKNSPNESRATFDSHNDAAAHLRHRGEAILNEDYGQVSANRKVITPLADDSVLERVRDELFHLDGNVHEPPSVFDGTILPILDASVLENMHLKCAPDTRAVLGRFIQVSQDLVTFSFGPIPGRNIAIIGKGSSSNDSKSNNLGLAVILSILRSLATCEKSEEFDFVIMNLLPAEEMLSEVLENECQNLNHNVRSVCILDIEASRNYVNDTLTTTNATRVEGKRFVFVLGMDRLGTFDMSGQLQLARHIKDAPLGNTHFVIWWLSHNALNSQMGMTGVSSFDGSVLLFGTSSLSKQLVGPLCDWDGEPMRVLFKDSTSGNDAAKVIPFRYGEAELEG